MFTRKTYVNRFVIFCLIITGLYVGPVIGQAVDAVPEKAKQEVAIAQAKPSPEKKASVTDTPSSDLQTEVNSLKAENAAVRELLKQMAEQQKNLLEQVDRLQKRLDSRATIDIPSASSTSTSTVNNPLTAVDPGPNVPPPYAVLGPPPGQPAAKQIEKEDRYRDGIIIYQNPDNAKVPFLLKFNINTQLRYLNTTDSKEFFVDHLGVSREVHNRNDITVNRAMFILAGYMFSPKLQYSFTAWTSAGASSIVLAGNIGWRFNKALTITGGYTGVPGSRSLVSTFPFFAPIDRSMADNFFRPGFTQGVWASGEPIKGFNYIAFVGNGLNTLSISANKIDTHLVYSGSVWWEPLGSYGVAGKSWQMYDDYQGSNKVRIRIGTSFTHSREDRFSNLDQSSPDNTSLYNSDGVLTFSTGAFAPGVTVDKATYNMWAIDGGLKWRGFSVNTQYFMRWLGNFEADGPLPLTSTFDHGFELTAGHFVVPKKLVLYVRGSKVFGQFLSPSEYGGGFKWYFLPTERIWMNGELIRVNHAPYGGAFTPYTAGMNGWVPMLQTVLAF